MLGESQSIGGQAFGRLLSDGKPDSTFGMSGTAPLVTSGQALVLQPSGQILVLPGILTQGAVCRYAANGSLDATFGGAGQAAGFGTPGGLAVIESNSEFIAAGSLTTTPSPRGSTDFLLVRYTASGSIDRAFGKTA